MTIRMPQVGPRLPEHEGRDAPSHVANVCRSFAEVLVIHRCKHVRLAFRHDQDGIRCRRPGCHLRQRRLDDPGIAGEQRLCLEDGADLFAGPGRGLRGEGGQLRGGRVQRRSKHSRLCRGVCRIRARAVARGRHSAWRSACPAVHHEHPANADAWRSRAADQHVRGHGRHQGRVDPAPIRHQRRRPRRPGSEAAAQRTWHPGPGDRSSARRGTRHGPWSPTSGWWRRHPPQRRRRSPS